VIVVVTYDPVSNFTSALRSITLTGKVYVVVDMLVVVETSVWEDISKDGMSMSDPMLTIVTSEVSVLIFVTSVVFVSVKVSLSVIVTSFCVETVVVMIDVLVTVTVGVDLQVWTVVMLGEQYPD
jgi:hypothetical protein